MTQNQKLKEAIEHIRKLHQEMLVTHPKISLLGATPEEERITEKFHAMMWMGLLMQKPNANEEADNCIRQIIIFSSILVDLGVIDKHAEFI